MKRRFLVPEIVQTSAMDCGPASLASLLKGCGLDVSYPRLRESCQTDVDGTSIDRLEDLACQFGLDAEQVILPADCLFDPAVPSLPCIAVVLLPDGLTHFVVVWRIHAGFVQLMDPAFGRRWISKSEFLRSLYRHDVVVKRYQWNSYARDDEFRNALRSRLEIVCTSGQLADYLVEAAYAAPDWKRIADLDAVVRLAGSVLRSPRGVHKARRLLDAYGADPAGLAEALPTDYYQVRPLEDDPESLRVTGAVLVRVRGISEDTFARSTDGVVRRARAPRERPFATMREIFRRTNVKALIIAGLVASIVIGLMTLIEGLLFRYVLDLDFSRDPRLLWWSLLVLATPLLASYLVERGLLMIAHAAGRQIDTQLRTSMLERLPRIRDEYFSSRLTSDLAMRGHNVSELKAIPELLAQCLTAASRLLFLTVGLWILAPVSPATILFMAVLGLVLPFAAVPMLMEGDLRTRAHLAALGNAHLNSLRGAEALWSHNAADALAHEHDILQIAWWKASRDRDRIVVITDTATYVVLTGLAAYLILDNLLSPQLSPGSVLLLAYWALNVPLSASTLISTLQEVVPLRNVARRALEIFAEDELGENSCEGLAPGQVHVELKNAQIARSQVPILSSLNLTINPGERVAIVGESGSGKSSLVQALLGFNHVDPYELLINGRPGTGERLAELRQRTVIIDSELYLWNKSILENLLYGTSDMDSMETALATSEFRRDLGRIAHGLAERIGENGSRLSGGEGQRLRIARALMRRDPAFVVLDEPFRGMDSRQRRRLLDGMLSHWRGSTILYVSHNLEETRAFDRVLVLHDQAIVEDGSPEALLADRRSRYATSVMEERELRAQLDEGWTRVRLADGGLRRCP